MNANYSHISKNPSSSEKLSPSQPQPRPRWKTLTLRIMIPWVAFLLLFTPIIVVLLSVQSIGSFTPAGLYCGVSGSDWYLAPTLTFGNFTITEVRAIDLTWNLVAGRGLQGGFALVTYRVANAALLRVAESVPVSYRAFEAISISQLNLFAIFPLIKAVRRTGGWRAKTTLVVLVLTAIFVLVLPTINDIITGYVQNSSPYWQFSNGTMELVTTVAKTCQSASSTADNIEMVPCLHGEILPIICVPGVGYRWGFTGVWLLPLLIVSSLWAFSLYGIWVDADRFSVLYRNGRKLGTWRAITDLATALGKEAGPDMSTLSDRELTREVDGALPVKYMVTCSAEGGLEEVVLAPLSSSSSTIA